ncbi:MAG: SurA N-terminal domain-containing protein [Alphaproteobacteria bacterium]
MLQVFRDHAHKWFVKILLWLIVLSFGLWGIGDIIYKFFAHRPVVTVGKHDISREELSHHLQKESARINEMTKGQVTAQQLKEIGMHTSVINRLVSQLVLSDELDRMNLGASDEILKEQIQKMPAFQTDGRFDANKFLSVLQQQGMNERAFLKEARLSMQRQQLLASITIGVNLPESYKNNLVDALTREKVFAFVEIDASKIKLDHSATHEQLESFYEQYKDKYTIPELRSITALVLDTKVLRHILGITDEQIRQSYNAQKENLKFPERRNIARLTYAQEDNAQKALALAKKGMSFAKILKEIPEGELEEPGLVVKEQIPEFAAKEIFALKSGDCTKIIPTGFGFHIFQVTKIEHPRTATFEEAKNEIESMLIQEQKSGKLDEIRSQIDDAIASGQTLADVAAKMKLAVHTFENINAKGQNHEGKPVFAKPTAMHASMLEKAFTVEQGLDSGFVDVPREGAFVLSVTKVSPAHAPAFADIAHKVQHDWEAEQRLEAASKLASSIASEAKSFTLLNALVKKHNLILSANHTLSRIELSKQGRKSADLLPVSLAQKAFMLAPEAAIAGRNDKGGFTVVMLQKSGGSKVTKEDKQKFSVNLDNMIQADISSATVNALKELHRIEINQEMLAQMMD